MQPLNFLSAYNSDMRNEDMVNLLHIRRTIRTCFLLSQGGDYDDDDVSSGMNDFSQPSESSQNQTMGFNNMSVFDATMLQGDKLVAQPHKVIAYASISHPTRY